MNDKVNFIEFFNEIKTKIEYFESLPEGSEERYNIWCELSDGFKNGFRRFELMRALAALKIARRYPSFIIYNGRSYDEYYEDYNRMIYEEFCKSKGEKLDG